MSSSTLSLAAVRERARPSLEADLMQITIASYRYRAQIAEDFSRAAHRRGQRGLAQGLLEAAATWKAMAEGLATQQAHTAGESK